MTPLGEQLFRLAQAQSDPALLLLVHFQLEMVLFYRGEPALARIHHTQALALYDPQVHRALAVRYGMDLGVGSYNGVGGHPEAGLTALAEALTVLETTELQYYGAELYRLKGALLLRAVPDVTQAEACFQQALALARQQQARSWELHAATSLACLWQAQGKRQAAYDLLAPVYGWFTEGFDTTDLQEARALLAALS